MAELTYLDLGRAAYQPTLELQQRLVEEVRAAPRERAWLLLAEHAPPVITLGRRGRPEDILVSPEVLAGNGVEVHRTTRGGEATFHGPGQLVGYPILALRRFRLSLRDYVRRLEEVLVGTLGRFGVEAGRREGRTGVWVGEGKVAAIGVAVARWVTWHGFALNVAADLSGFGWIVPCGEPGARVTSLAEAGAREVAMDDVKAVLVETFAEAFGLEARPAPLP